MIKLLGLQGLYRSVCESSARSRGRPIRRSLSVGVHSEFLEERRMLAGSLAPGSLDPSFGQGGVVTTSIGSEAVPARPRCSRTRRLCSLDQ